MGLYVKITFRAFHKVFIIKITKKRQEFPAGETCYFLDMVSLMKKLDKKAMIPQQKRTRKAFL